MTRKSYVLQGPRLERSEKVLLRLVPYLNDVEIARADPALAADLRKQLAEIDSAKAEGETQ